MGWEQQRGQWLRLGGGTFWIFPSQPSLSQSAKWDDNSISLTGGLNKLMVLKYLGLGLAHGKCSINMPVLVIIITNVPMKPG